MAKKLLVIDDEESVVFMISEVLSDLGHEVVGAVTPEEGLERFEESSFDLVLVDIKMPGMNGYELTDALLTRDPQANILVNTGYPDDPLVVKALDRGAMGVVRKPFEIDKIFDYLKG
ncbi:MAG: response regulator [Spirochaetota bacterium]